MFDRGAHLVDSTLNQTSRPDPITFVYSIEIVAVVFLLIYRFILKRKETLYTVVFFVFLLVVVIRADFIYSWIDMNVSCAGGPKVEVYETVEIGPEYFDQDGWPIYLTKKPLGKFDEMVFSNRYSVAIEGADTKYGAIRLRVKLVDSRAGDMMSKVDFFRNRPGWYWSLFHKDEFYNFSSAYFCGYKSTYVGGDYSNKENILHSVFRKNY